MKNIKLAILLIGIQLLAQNIYAQLPNSTPMKDFPTSVSKMKDVKKLTIKHEILVNYTPNVVYIKRDNLDLNLQILSPVIKSKKPLPCIVYVQGSAWMKQNVYMGIPKLSNFAERGFVVAIVEYRPSIVATFPAQVQDAKTAIRFMRKNAEKYNIDPNNIFIWGDSSGGHTAVFVGLCSGNMDLDTEAYTEFSDNVNAVIDFYGPTDIAKMKDFPSIFDHDKPTSPEGMLIGKLTVSENPEKAQKANPINYIFKEKAIPPILIAHGDMDRIVPFNQSELLAQKLKVTNKTFEYYSLAGADHGTTEFWTSTMFDIVEKFVRKNMK
jgi:acetyl esterase/lipase